MFLLLSGCNEALVEPNSTNNLEKKSATLFPDTYVHGYVTKDSKAVKYAIVKLLDEDGNYLTQTTANTDGYYSMIICPFGFGQRTVESTYLGETGSNHFTFVYGTWDYEADIFIGSNPDKINY